MRHLMYSPVCQVYFPFSNTRRELEENSALLSCYAASGGNSLQTFQDTLSVTSYREKNRKMSLNLEDGTDRLSRNVGKKLPLLTA